MKQGIKLWQILIMTIVMIVTVCSVCIATTYALDMLGYLSTPTLVPVSTAIPTETVYPTSQPDISPTSDPMATHTSTPTYSPNIDLQPSMTLIAVTPISSITPMPKMIRPFCYCTTDLYNCDNFSNQQSAQVCFNLCWANGKGDVHHLDSDGDELACED
jgi:hypothetical protein